MEQQHGLSSKEAEQTILNRFGKLFPSLQPFRPYDEALLDLGKVMEDKSGQIRATSTARQKYSAIAKDSALWEVPSSVKPSSVL